MSISSIIATASVVVAPLALFAGILTGLRLFRLWWSGECSGRMSFIGGVALFTVGFGLHRCWWLAWRLFRDYGSSATADLMEDSPVILCFYLALFLGLLLMIRFFTWTWPWPPWMRLPWLGRLASKLCRRPQANQ